MKADRPTAADLQATIDRVRAVLAEFEDNDNDDAWWFVDKLREALGDAK